MTNKEQKYDYIIKRLQRISTPTGISYSGDETISKEDSEWLINLIERQQEEITDLSNRIMQAIYHIEDNCIAKNEYALEDLKDLNNYIRKDKIRKLLKFHKEQIKLVGSHEFYNQELGYIEALAELLKAGD